MYGAGRKADRRGNWNWIRIHVLGHSLRFFEVGLLCVCLRWVRSGDGGMRFDMFRWNDVCQSL